MRTTFRSLLVAALAALTPTVAPPAAADDPSIEQPLRGAVQAAMRDFVEDRTIDGVFRHYDPITDSVWNLKLDSLHAGIVRKGDFLVSCAEFQVDDGRRVDVDSSVRRSARRCSWPRWRG